MDKNFRCTVQIERDGIVERGSINGYPGSIRKKRSKNKRIKPIDLAG